MRFKVEFEIEISQDEARELAEDESTEDDFKDDVTSCTESNIQHTIEDDQSPFWTPEKVRVNLIT